MDSTAAVTEETGHVKLAELSSRGGSSVMPGQARHEAVNSRAKSSSTDGSGRASTPLEQVTCTGVKMSYQKEPEGDFYSTLTRKSLELDGIGGSGRSGLRLPSTRVTVYPQRDIASSWRGRRDFSLPKLDVLKMQLETRWADEEHGSNQRSLSVPGASWLPSPWDLGRTRSADSYFRHGVRHSEQTGKFQTRVQMEKAFNAYVKSKSQPSLPPGRPNTSTSMYSTRQASASPTEKDAVDKPATLARYSAPNRQRVVRKSPPWRSLMNRRPQGVRADNTNLCPYHCRCCFNEVNDIEGSTIYKMDLETLYD